jgi:hypothetical protein
MLLHSLAYLASYRQSSKVPRGDDQQMIPWIEEEIILRSWIAYDIGRSEDAR